NHEAAKQTLRRLEARIEVRRDELRDALRSLDSTYSRRRDELARRASELRAEPPSDAAPGGGIPVPGVDLAHEPPARPGVDARLDRILDEWRRRSAAHASFDIRFTLRERDSKWGDDVSGTGQVVLTSAGRMFFEVDRDPGGKHDRERIICADDAMHQFISKSK